MIYKDFIKCWSYDDYLENKDQILPTTIVFNVEEGNEKLIFDDQELVFVPKGGREGQVLQKTADGYQWVYNKAVTKVSSLTSLPIIYSLVVADIDSDTSLSISKIPDGGQEIHIMVHNTKFSSVIVTIPNGGQYVNLSEDTLEVKPNAYREINILSDGEKMYIRSI